MMLGGVRAAAFASSSLRQGGGGGGPARARQPGSEAEGRGGRSGARPPADSCSSV